MQKPINTIGVKNIRKLLNLLYKNIAIFNLFEKDDKVYAQIKLPISL